MDCRVASLLAMTEGGIPQNQKGGRNKKGELWARQLRKKLDARAELSAPPGRKFTSWTSWPSSPSSPFSPSSLS
jgi:hypothetical protein